MSKIRVYTKEIIAKEYDAGLANSLHFELVGEETVELNRGYGILFPTGRINEDNTILPLGGTNPYIIETQGKYVIVCELIKEDGEKIDTDKWYVWETDDFVTFNELGLVSKEEIVVKTGIAKNYEDVLTNNGMGLTAKVKIAENIKEAVLTRWVPPYGIEEKCSRVFKYPLIKGFADPVLFNWNDKWYFLATNDLNGNIGIFMREAESVDGLFEDDARVSVILDYDEEKEFIQTFWAPEWHIIGGIPYILFAVGGKKWAPQSHMMKYKGSGDIMNPDSWETPVRVCKKDGSFLEEDGITLDMTYLKTKSQSYVLWSERYNIGSPLDSGSMIYIATIDDSNPTVLTSDKVLLSRPLLGWENVAGTINNEGPYCLVKDGKVYVTYSGGDACGHYYAVGLLKADEIDDLLCIDSWTKLGTPVFNAYTLDGIDGPGHSSFFIDEKGKMMIAFHGQDNGRQSGIHEFFIAKNGAIAVFD